MSYNYGYTKRSGIISISISRRYIFDMIVFIEKQFAIRDKIKQMKIYLLKIVFIIDLRIFSDPFSIFLDFFFSSEIYSSWSFHLQNNFAKC
jgi:hypothetical protein